MATLQPYTLGAEGGTLLDLSVVAMLIWYLLSRPLVAVKCEATTNNFKPHIQKRYGFIVSTDVFFFFSLNTINLSICQNTLVLPQTGTVSGTEPTPARKPNQFNVFLDERDVN